MIREELLRELRSGIVTMENAEHQAIEEGVQEWDEENEVFILGALHIAIAAFDRVIELVKMEKSQIPHRERRSRT